MLVGPELEICLTQDPECWAYRRTHIFQQDGRNRMLAAKVLPLLSSPKRAHSTYIHLDHILTRFQRTTQFGYFFLLLLLSMLFNFESCEGAVSLSQLLREEQLE